MCLTRESLAALTLALVTATVMSAEAHSLKELESQLGNREKYFQPVDKGAPGFELRDAAGRIVRLADFHDKVVVLHFNRDINATAREKLATPETGVFCAWRELT